MPAAGHRPLTSGERWFVGLSWVPLVAFALTLFYLRGYEGWGRLAAAPLLIPAILLSLVLGLTGLLLIHRARRRNRSARRSVEMK